MQYNENNEYISAFKNLRRYKVFEGKKLIYQVVTSQMEESYIIKEIKAKFAGHKQPLKIFLNDTKIAQLGYKSERPNHKILDRETNYLYHDIKELADNFDINIAAAKTLVNTRHRFKWIKK